MSSALASDAVDLVTQALQREFGDLTSTEAAAMVATGQWDDHPAAMPRGPKVRRTYSLAADAQSILEDIKTGPSNASAYLSELVRATESAWRRALAQLQQQGWQERELRAVCEGAAGFTGELSALPEVVSRRGEPYKWGLSDAQWQAAIEALQHPHIAHAVGVLSAEQARYNPRLDRGLHRLTTAPLQASSASLEG